MPWSKVAVAAVINTLPSTQEAEQEEAADLPPKKVGISRVQSMAQKTVQDEAIQSRANGLAPPPPPMPKAGGRIKKSKTIANSPSQDKNEMRQIRGSAIQEDDSLTSGSTVKGESSGKGKSSTKKEDAF